VTSAGFADACPAKLRFENQQKKTSLPKKQKQAMFFSLLRFQLFVDSFVTSAGFADARPLCFQVKIESPWLCHIFYFTRSLKSNAFQLLL
jgi:hypothetical protein